MINKSGEIKSIEIFFFFFLSDIVKNLIFDDYVANKIWVLNL